MQHFFIDYDHLFHTRPSGAKCAMVLILFVCLFMFHPVFYVTQTDISQPSASKGMPAYVASVFEVLATLPYCCMAGRKVLILYYYAVTFLYAVLYSFIISVIVAVLNGILKIMPPQYLYMAICPQSIHVLLSLGFAIYYAVCIKKPLNRHGMNTQDRVWQCQTAGNNIRQNIKH